MTTTDQTNPHDPWLNGPNLETLDRLANTPWGDLRKLRAALVADELPAGPRPFAVGEHIEFDAPDNDTCSYGTVLGLVDDEQFAHRHYRVNVGNVFGNDMFVRVFAESELRRPDEPATLGAIVQLVEDQLRAVVDELREIHRT